MTTRRDIFKAFAALVSIPITASMASCQTFLAPASSADSGNEWIKDRWGAMARNIELLAFHEFEPGGVGYQMAMQNVNGRYYLYCCHWWKNGISIFDVTDPANYKFIRYVPEPSGNNAFAMVKLQVAEGIGVTHVQPRNVDLFFGPQPVDAVFDEGVLIWDFKDPEDPKVLSHWRSGSPAGTHRNFYNGGRYVHLTAGHPDYLGNIYRILDISNPRHPVEVGLWAHPDQGPPDPNHHGMPPYMLHAPYIEGNRAYLAYAGQGMIILDISDISKPTHIGHLNVHPPFGGGAGGASVHTSLPFGGNRPLALVTTEGERPFILHPDKLRGKSQPMNIIGIADISDPSNPALISTCPIPIPPPGSPWGSNYATLDGLNYPFGPHNLHQPSGLPVLENRTDRIYCSYFQAGLRVFDVSDEHAPREIAAYCPQAPKTWNWQRNGGGFPGPLTTCAEDIIVDDRGNIFMTNSQDGIHILRVTI